MFSLLKKNSAFFIPYLLFLLIGGIALLKWDKMDIEIFINSYHSIPCDLFFEYWTLVGLGYLIIPVLILCAFISLRSVIMAAITFLLSFGINDTLKYYADTLRPLQTIELLHKELYYVPGVEVYRFHSFPSGHSAITFGLCCLLALIAKKPSTKFILFVIAFLVGYSRMYLAEHFLIDVFGGSLVGVACAIITYLLIVNWKWLNKFAAIDKPLISL